MRTLLVLLALACPVAANPAPKFRPKPPPAVSAGVWELTWASTTGRMELRPDGSYSLDWCGRAYAGRWCWVPKTRTLHVTDTADGGMTWADWSVALGDGHEGEGVLRAASGDPVKVPAAVRPLRAGR